MRLGPWIAEARRVGLVLVGIISLAPVLAGPSEAAREGRGCGREPVDLTVEYGDLVTCEIRPAGDTDVFRIAGTGGETIRVQLADRSRGRATPCIEIRDPDGVVLLDRACGSIGRDLVLERTGTYSVVVSENADDRDQRVRYALVADRIDPTSPAAALIKHGETINANLKRSGDLDAYFFEAAVGDRVAIRIFDRTRGSPAPCFQLYGPTGEPFAAPTCGSRSQEFLLPAAGRHSILITERPRSGIQVVRYRVRLTCRSGVCPNAGLEEVAGCLALRGAPLREVAVRFTQPDEGRQRNRTDVRGCVKFQPVAGKPFQFRLQGPEVPD